MKSFLLFALLGLILTKKTYTPNQRGIDACEHIPVDSDHKKKCTIANMNLGDDHRCCYVEGLTTCRYFPDDADELKSKASELKAKIDCSSQQLNFSFIFLIFALLLL